MKTSYLDYDWNPVINFETGGKSYYERFLKKATWPGGASGITIGVGADLGYITAAEFDKYFAGFFTNEEIAKLKATIGLKGQQAKDRLSSVKNIQLDWEDASTVFVQWTLPKFWKLTNQLWPGIDKLHEKAQVALVSLVFNRGAATRGPSRIEMLNIKPLVIKQDYKAIAAQIRSMKRLWQGKNMEGLLKRRDIEAQMVETV